MLPNLDASTTANSAPPTPTPKISSAPSTPLLPDYHLGNYRILRHLATGGMGMVYQAQDEATGRIVALKVLTPELAGQPALVARFRREAKVAARLSHKNIVTLYEADEADGLHFLALEYVEGMSLMQYIRSQGKVEPEIARGLTLNACRGLEHAFFRGVIHRDIKPSNIILAIENGRARVKLTDLGLSRLVKDEDEPITNYGTTLGTLDYMAPEQARDSASADTRSDIYSLGCTLYHMLAGQPPCGRGTVAERLYRHLSVTPPDVREFNSRIPEALALVVQKMLAKNPNHRYQTPTQVIAALAAASPERGPDSTLGRLSVPPMKQVPAPADGWHTPPASPLVNQPGKRRSWLTRFASWLISKR